MAEFKIYLGNKNYSSWSLRGWLMLKATGADFDEEVIPLSERNTREEILKYSPSGRVPVLHHGTRRIWDSLAIGEYLNELFPDARLWPADVNARRLARSVSAEMHAGFSALRENMPMNIRRSDACRLFRVAGKHADEHPPLCFRQGHDRRGPTGHQPDHRDLAR